MEFSFEKEHSVRKAKRVQRKRCAGWKMPPNTVYVGRPTKWGNPYAPEMKAGLITREEAVKGYETILRDELADHPDFLDELKGKDLACWCPLDKPCHVDVILKLLDQASGNVNKEHL